MRMKEKKMQRGREPRQRRSPSPSKRTGSMRRPERMEYPDREIFHSYNSETMLQREIMSFKSREDGRMVKMVRHVVDHNEELLEPPFEGVGRRHISPDMRRRSPDLRRNGRERSRHRSPDLRRRSPGPRHAPSSLRRRSPDARPRSPEARHIAPSLRTRSPDVRRRSPDFRGVATSLRRRTRSPNGRRRSPEPRQRSSPKFVEMSPARRGSPFPRRNSPGARQRSPFPRQMSPELRRMAPIMRPRAFDVGEPLERPIPHPHDVRYSEFEHRQFMEINRQPMMLVRRVIEPEMPYNIERESRSIPGRGAVPPGYEWERSHPRIRSPGDELMRDDHLSSISHNYREKVARIRYSPQPRSPPRSERPISSYVEERPAKVNKVARDKSLSPKIAPKLNDIELLTKVIYDESQPTMLPPPSVRKAIIMRNQPNKPKAYRSKPYIANDTTKSSGNNNKKISYDDFPLDKKRGPEVRGKAMDIRAPASSRAARSSFSPPRRLRVMETMESRRDPPADYDRGYPISPYGTVGPRRTPPRHRSPSPFNSRPQRKRSWAELSPPHPMKRRAPEPYHPKPERSIPERRRGGDYDREKDLRNHHMDLDQYQSRPIRREWAEEPVHRRRRSFD